MPISKLPQAVLDGWNNRQGVPVLSTVDEARRPNTIYVSNVAILDEAAIAIADGAFHKTRANIEHGSPGAFLFLTETAAYQLKGSFEYHTEGAEMERAKTWANWKFPIRGIAILRIEEIYNGAQKLH